MMVKEFQSLIYAYFSTHGRTFSWRSTHNPYHIVVSEIMLQQTQTYRVKNKYEQFIDQFPTMASLAKAAQSQVLTAWQGLGYNRRALSLHAFAMRVIDEYAGTIPQDPVALQTFKGIGPATAASICAFAFNQPTVFIETNIRAVFIHCFFSGKNQVHDKEILPLVKETLDTTNPRLWYYALMDYGVMLKKELSNPSRLSAHHTRQSTFEGSSRQVRGMILKMLIELPFLPRDTFFTMIPRGPDIICKILNDLEQEGFIYQSNGCYALVS